ncbi:MAG: hypothetical protein LBT16_06580 [Treponema sp.]|jgi:hypothetical protein|nr:hypothetical protein [Treponema sp.]
MSQTVIQIISFAGLLFSVILFALALRNWGQPHMPYLAAITAVSFLNSLGYYLEITSVTLDAVMIAYKVQYCSGNYMGVLAFLFSMDYADRPVRNPPLWLGLFIHPFFVNMLVLIDPSLYAGNITLVPVGDFPRLSFDITPYYIANFIYNFGLSTAGALIIIAIFSYTNRKGIIHRIVFSALIFLPTTPKILWWMGLFPEFDFSYLSYTVMLVTIYWCVMRTKEAEWRGLGRNVVITNSPNAIITVNKDKFIIDVNRKFREYFPSFSCTENITSFSGFIEYLKSWAVNALPPDLFEVLFENLDTNMLDVDHGEFPGEFTRTANLYHDMAAARIEKQTVWPDLYIQRRERLPRHDKGACPNAKRECRQKPVPRVHEPRNTHPHERDYRHERSYAQR